MDILMYLIAILGVSLLIFMLVKNMDIKITLLGVGLLLIYMALIMGQSIAFRNFVPTGTRFLDPIFVIPQQFISTLSRAGLIILVLGGYSAYMTKIGANRMTVLVLTKPLGKIKSIYALVPAVFLVGNLLSLVVPSASNLAIILLATLYPVLIASGMSKLTAAGVIATTATVMPTPLGGDNVAIVEELRKTAQFSELTVADYVFKSHALVSIPTLLVMAIAHYFWQKRMDRNLPAGAPELLGETVDTATEYQIKGAFIGIYAILPVLPIVFLLIAYFFDMMGLMTIEIDVNLATFSSFIIAIICDILYKKNFKETLGNTNEFFIGMGKAMSVVALLTAASVFVVGLKSIGLIAGLQNIMQNIDVAGFVLPLVLVLFTAVIVILSGSGVALFYAMVPLMVPLALAAGIAPFAVTLPMGMAGNLLRACSPVAAVILIVAGTVKEAPYMIVKRTIVPSLIAVVFMFTLSMLVYL